MVTVNVSEIKKSVLRKINFMLNLLSENRLFLSSKKCFFKQECVCIRKYA